MTDKFDDLHPEYCRTRTPREFFTGIAATPIPGGGPTRECVHADITWKLVHALDSPDAKRRSAILLDYSHKD
ncbi:hypothetical protein [Nocardia gipuzkoensis]